MIPAQESRRRGRWQPMRLAALSLLRMGVAGEVIAISGMIFGIVAGVCFLFTSETENPSLFWLLALVCCILRIISLRIEGFMAALQVRKICRTTTSKSCRSGYRDAVTLIGFGFAASPIPGWGSPLRWRQFFPPTCAASARIGAPLKKEAASGPMTRVHRLLLLSLASILMVTGFGTFDFQTPLPVITMWIIFFGCIATVSFGGFASKAEFPQFSYIS